MIKKILVANRGEIAVRIMRSIREMGLVSVAVYSEADKQALHVKSADEAVFIGASSPAESYLNIDVIVNAAIKSGAEAVHPGYGFLSENADFARAVKKAGLIFIGPDAETIETLGDKITARKLMQKNGVPTASGLDENVCDLQEDELKKFASTAGYPLLVKASGGGGGKGMRIVKTDAELFKAVKQASSEALAAFGNATVFLEKYIEKPRHVEIQIMADNHGNVIHLNERECSIQRRHQKIIEETPCVALTEKLRNQMGEAAVQAAKACNYKGAGTVEFLLDKNGGFYFLEVNTRLQVEHPITEMVTGFDLVRMQIDVACDKVLSVTQDEVKSRGHAIECRIYAEDASENFMPSPGVVHYCQTPTGPGVRLDTGIYSGAEVPVYYDPIMSKLVVYAENRDAAISRMSQALKDCVVLGVKTSISFMDDLINSEKFISGDTHTHFIEENFTDWKETPVDDEIALAGFVLADEYAVKASDSKGETVTEKSPWLSLGKWDLC